MLTSSMIDLSFPRSEFLSRNAADCVCRCHMTLSVTPAGNGAGEWLQENAGTPTTAIEESSKVLCPQPGSLGSSASICETLAG